MSTAEPWKTDVIYNRYILWFIYCCIVYSIIGFSWGVLVGGYEPLRHFVQGGLGKNIMLAHAHLNLLGWVEMAIFASIYFVVPRVVQRSIYSIKLVGVHFWIHNVGLAAMVIFFTLAGVYGKYFFIGVFVGGVMVLLANIIWAYNLYKTCQSWVKSYASR